MKKQVGNDPLHYVQYGSSIHGTGIYITNYASHVDNNYYYGATVLHPHFIPSYLIRRSRGVRGHSTLYWESIDLLN